MDVRTFCPDVIFDEQNCPYLRRTVAEMLNTARASLPAGFRLRAGSCLRTLAMQKGGWDSYHRRLREEHPDWPLSALRRATNRYFAPYDQKAPPGHCTGGAVDVGLLDADGNGVDVTSPTQGWQAAYTWSDKISAAARANRMIMVEAMLGAGFSNCRDEFWHYSYGDSAWAVRTGELECPYGWAFPAVALDVGFPDASAENLTVETLRDLNGRAIRAEGSCSLSPGAGVTPEGQPCWRVALRWAQGIPVTVRLNNLEEFSAGVSSVVEWDRHDPRIYIGDDRGAWQSVTDVHRTDSGFLIEVTPTDDRVILTTSTPPSAEQTA